MIQRRTGTIVVMTAFSLIGIIIFAAFAVDFGIVRVAQRQMQINADSAALAAAQELLTHEVTSLGYSTAKSRAQELVRKNAVLGKTVSLLQNDANKDFQVGYFAWPFTPSNQLDTSSLKPFNAVSITVRQDESANGRLPAFFSRIISHPGVEVTRSATAAYVNRIRGFKSIDENLPLLPISIDIDMWNSFLENPDEAGDAFGYNADTGSVFGGGDSIHELVIYPTKTGTPGNFGTVDIGSNNSNTPTLVRQIRHGVTQGDMAFHGGDISLDDSGELTLSGDPGGKYGPVMRAIERISGQKRVIPLYKAIEGTGQNARYIITGFAGVRVMHAQLKSGDKRVTIQPAPIVLRNIIPADEDDAETSTFIYSPIALVK